MLSSRAQFPSFQSLFARSCTPQLFRSPHAKDLILIQPLHDGGVISYLQEDGILIHTLNTTEGFRRKILQLGLTVDGVDPSWRIEMPKADKSCTPNRDAFEDETEKA